MKRITLSIPDELYDELEKRSEANTRTITQEFLHRVKLGLSTKATYTVATPSIAPSYTGIPANSMGGVRVSNIAEPNEIAKELIKKIEAVNDVGYQGTPEDWAELTKELKENGYSYNAYKKTLDHMNERGVWEVVHKF